MIILLVIDVFEHKGKTAIYCKAEESFDEKTNFSQICIDNKTFDIIECDRLKSISGEISFTFLIDTNEYIEVNKKIEVI